MEMKKKESKHMQSF